ncbi:MAG: LytTR family DNA-binding domain-containing protein [Clostridiales bacterium]
MKLKVLIADDENGMRNVLRKLINKRKNLELIFEAKDGMEIFKFSEASKVDIAFLDVDMPQRNGVECAKMLIDINPKIFIIFITAHSEYMMEAFEMYAFDYLIKPFRIDRFNKTLDRLIETYKQNFGYFKLHNFKGNKKLKKLVIKNKDGVNFVDMDEIILIQRENRSTVLYTISNRFTTSEGLSIIEQKLDASLFLRTHKSYIINLSMIQKINPYGRWTYTITLKDTEKDALLTHEKYELLQEIFSK